MANSYGFDPVAWSVDGGRHRGELLRFLAYAATGGAEGIVSPGDCRVRQLSTPGPQVRIDAGGVLIANRSPGVRNQSYAANGRTETRLDVTATGGTGRHDLVVVRVEDPQYAPWSANKPPVGQEPNWQYVKPFIIENVPAGTKTFAELNLGYAATELARLEIPPGTTTITDAMVKDVRQLATPRFISDGDIVTPAGSTLTTAMTSFVNFPNASKSTTVPRWATEAQVIIRCGIMGFGPGAGNGNGAADGHLQVLFDTMQSAGFSQIDHNAMANQNVQDAATYTVSAYGKFDVTALRGKTVVVRPRAKRVFEGLTTGRLEVSAAQTVEFDIRYSEKAV